MQRIRPNNHKRPMRGTACALTLGVMLTVLSTLGVGLPASAQASDGAAPSNEARILLLQAKPKAYGIIEAAGRSDRARDRLAALEAAQHAPDAAVDLARDGLTDENPAVRFAALVTIGKLKLNDLALAAVDLMKDDNPSVRAAAIFAAKRCGRDVNLTPLAQLLASGDASARANAAMLVGQLGDPQALGMLREMADAPMPRVLPAQRTWVRLQFAEAMIRLDPENDKVLGSIRAGMYSTLDEVRVLAIQILGEAGDKSILGGLAHIAQQNNPIHVKIAAAQSMLQMGDTQGVPILMKATRYDVEALRTELTRFLRNMDQNSEEARSVRALLDSPDQQARVAGEVRAQAARALGWSRSEASARRLTELLADPQPIVRVAASAAVLRAAQ